MQIQDLNKYQTILLVLLISFVTSIATGIMTSSLLQQAPIEVTRNINRIVEKTIETVTPGQTIQKEVTTVIVKEDDLIIDSINKNINSIVRITERDPITETNVFYGIGLVVSKEGLIAADRKVILPGNRYLATLSDGSIVSLTPLNPEKQTNFILFKVFQSDKNPRTFIPAVLGGGDLRLGQTLVGLGGDTKNAVSVGRVISLSTKDFGVGTSTVKYISNIESDISAKDLVGGSPAFNLSGDVVGVKLSSDPLKNFTPVSVLKKELEVLIEVPKDTTKTP